MAKRASPSLGREARNSKTRREDILHLLTTNFFSVARGVVSRQSSARWRRVFPGRVCGGCSSPGSSPLPARWHFPEGESPLPITTPPGKLRKRSEEHTSELQSRLHLVCRLLLEKKK